MVLKLGIVLHKNLNFHNFMNLMICTNRKWHDWLQKSIHSEKINEQIWKDELKWSHPLQSLLGKAPNWEFRLWQKVKPWQSTKGKYEVWNPRGYLYYIWQAQPRSSGFRIDHFLNLFPLLFWIYIYFHIFEFLQQQRSKCLAWRFRLRYE